MSVFGFLNLDKPAGWTSHDCVARLRRLLQTKRIGHGGTLDPMATGVLPIAVGSATRLLQFLPTAKAYRATIRLGVTTTTDDITGDVLQVQSAAAVTFAQVQQALTVFQGTIQQRPPLYSAIQVKGQRLYQLARKGETLEPEPRAVEVYSLQVLDWQTLNPDQPELLLHVHCGPGTYIRSIARDLGAVLQTGGTLAQLQRTQSCGFEVTHSLTLEQVEQQMAQGILTLTPPAVALQHLPQVALEPLMAHRWCQGQAIAQPDATTEGWVYVYDAEHPFLGIGWQAEGYLRPKVVQALEKLEAKGS